MKIEENQFLEKYFPSWFEDTFEKKAKMLEESMNEKRDSGRSEASSSVSVPDGTRISEENILESNNQG